jgi:hypothetical protein
LPTDSRGLCRPIIRSLLIGGTGPHDEPYGDQQCGDSGDPVLQLPVRSISRYRGGFDPGGIDGLVGHAKITRRANVCSSAQKHLDVLNEATGIMRIRKEAIMVDPMTDRERLAGCQHNLDRGTSRSNRVCQFHPIQSAGHSDVTNHQSHAPALQQIERLVRARRFKYYVPRPAQLIRESHPH